MFQVGLPLGIAIGFWMQEKPCSASAMMWWCGQNFFMISIYIKDASAQALPLVGGEIHDWNYILSYHHLLGWDQQIGNAAWLLGVLMIIAASLYGVITALRQKV